MNLIHINILFITIGILLGILQRKQKGPIQLYIFIGIILSLCPSIAYYALGYHNEFPIEFSLLWVLSGFSIFLTWPLILKCHKYLRFGIIIFCIIVTSVGITTFNTKIESGLPKKSVMHNIIYTVAQSEINKALSAKISNGVIKNKGYYKIDEKNIGVNLLKNTETPSNTNNKDFRSDSTLTVFLDENIKIVNLEKNETKSIYMISGNAEIMVTVVISKQENKGVWKPVKTFNPKIKVSLNGELNISKKETIFTKIGIKI